MPSIRDSIRRNRCNTKQRFKSRPYAGSGCVDDGGRYDGQRIKKHRCVKKRVRRELKKEIRDVSSEDQA